MRVGRDGTTKKVSPGSRASPFETENAIQETTTTPQTAVDADSAQTLRGTIMSDPELWNWCMQLSTLAEEIAARLTRESSEDEQVDLLSAEAAPSTRQLRDRTDSRAE